MKGQWITCPGCDAPWVTGYFEASFPTDAEIDICGLGFFELYLNGEKVSQDVLTPAWTDYTPRPGRRLLYPITDTMRHRVCFLRWPLKLKSGRNELRVLLGNGWYNQRERNVEGKLWYGDGPCLRFELRWREGEAARSFVSGPELTFAPSRIIQNNLYTGETHDLRLPSPEAAVQAPVALCRGPEGALERQTCPADRIVRCFAPTPLSCRDGVRVYDAGQNLTGWAALTVEGARGETVTVRYAEALDGTGNLDFASCGKDFIQTNRYISAGRPIRCHPHFTWHGFRYVEVTGPASEIEIQQVHADIAVTGAFSCSDPVLSWLAKAYLNTRLANMHCGVPSDCPHRERLGYTGDGQATAMTDMYLLNGDLFYRKWIRDILDCQDPVSGHVQHTAPFYGGGGGPGGWGGAVVLVPWAHYCRYGDAGVLARAWPHMRKWADYMASRRDDRGAVVWEEEKGWCLGDWCAPEPMALPEPFVNTCYLARCLGIMENVAGILGEKADDLSRRRAEAQQTLEALWWDGAHFAGGVQGADALALEAGLGGQSLADRMAAHYEAASWFDTGFLASGSVIRQLFRFGHGDTALRLLTSRTPGHSFGWQMEQGADTLWERWDGRESHSHPMFGGVLEGVFRGLCGVELTEPDLLRPFFPKDMDHLSFRTVTRLGETRVSWRREGGRIVLNVRMPAPGKLIWQGRTYTLEMGETRIAVDPSYG